MAARDPKSLVAVARSTGLSVSSDEVRWGWPAAAAAPMTSPRPVPASSGRRNLGPTTWGLESGMTRMRFNHMELSFPVGNADSGVSC